jgi:UDP-N-acetylmuramoyl-tripeptide--D-alanyl-D-alanine ligase
MTALWTAADLLEATGGDLRAPFTATGVSIDTRTLLPGDLFVALCTATGDGHDHVPDALAKGAAGCMVHWEMTGRALIVDDTLAGLARMGGYARARFTGRLAAITGSVGKTTTKEMLRTILAAQAPTHAAVASYNNQWGLPLTLARMPPNATFCVAEIGMNHPGEIEPLARLARPHVAVITTIEKAHIGHLGSMEAIADEKASLLHSLEPGGIAVLPADSPWLPRLRAAADSARIITFGTDALADARLVSAETDADGSDVAVDLAGVAARFRLAAPGRHMAMNALAALTAAAALGIPPAAAGDALNGFVPMAGRGARRRIDLPGGTALLLDESYNGNGASMRAALSVLRLLPATRRIAVLGDMLELGTEAEAEHIALADDVAAAADRLFACGPLMRHLYNAVPPALRGAHLPDSAALAEIIAREIRPGDAILVKGSLGSRMKLVVAALDRLAEPA